MKKIRIVTGVLLVLVILATPIATIFLGQNTIRNVYADESTLEATENTEDENITETVEITTEEVTKDEEPNVKISITEPFEWQRNGKAEVSITVYDVLYTGKFEIAKVEARIGSNGSYTDITDTMSVSVTENCSLYIQVTDSNGKVYTKTRQIGCFDKDKPSLNAGITSGMLTIQATDNSSGVKAVYVNGQEFTDLTGNGTLVIKLQSFDANFEYFSIQAMDYAGNLSDVYKTKNPYYQDPQANNTAQKVPTLPENVKPSGVSDATASVLNYTNTSSNANDKEKDGKEFYTIVTDNEKVFYLIIDNTQDSDNVYFLTEISENDLLNVTGTTYETLEPHSAVVQSSLPKTESTVNKIDNTKQEENDENEKNITKEPIEEQKEEQLENKNKASTYIFYIVAAIISIVVIYFLKFYRRKGENFEDDDENMDEYEEYDDEEYEKESDFFDSNYETEEDYLEESEDEEEE